MGRVCVGVIVGAHGVRGAVRVKSFTAEPADIGSYGPVEDEATGRSLALKVIGQAKGLVIARLHGVEDRNAAEALKGVRLSVPRDRLPETDEDEFLYTDLVGLRAEMPDGTPLGTVRGIFDFGAGEVLDIQGPNGGLMVPFTRAAVPVVDVAGKRLVVDPPAFAEEEGDAEEGGASEASDWRPAGEAGRSKDCMRSMRERPRSGPEAKRRGKAERKPSERSERPATEAKVVKEDQGGE